MGNLPEIKNLVSCILYLVKLTQYLITLFYFMFLLPFVCNISPENFRSISLQSMIFVYSIHSLFYIISLVYCLYICIYLCYHHLYFILIHIFHCVQSLPYILLANGQNYTVVDNNYGKYTPNGVFKIN